jgi:hypothetical protein
LLAKFYKFFHIDFYMVFKKIKNKFENFKAVRRVKKIADEYKNGYAFEISSKFKRIKGFRFEETIILK